MTPAPDPMEERIVEFFEENFEMLRIESGHSLSPQAKENARLQVLLYWRKLREVASRVTDTEVRLSLPGQVTPGGRTFGIEGIVDIVREDDITIMYDIKTHNADAIRGNLPEYEKQLNIYAHIWQTLRGQELDATAVISTDIPAPLQEALRSGIENRIQTAMNDWQPLIDVTFDRPHVADTIAAFGAVVDAIECGAFAPPPPTMLSTQRPGSRRSFVRDVCHNCDGRFSCSSYRAYARNASTRRELDFTLYYRETERDEWVITALDTAPDADTLDALD